MKPDTYRTGIIITGIFRKRKASFFAELKEKQQLEKRKQQESFENERKLKEVYIFPLDAFAL